MSGVKIDNILWGLKLPFKKKDTVSHKFNISKIIDTINPLSVIPVSKVKDDTNILLSTHNPKIKCFETKLPYVLRRNL